MRCARLLLSCFALLGALGLCKVSRAQQDCGAADSPCTLESGDYLVALPGEPEGAPVMLWLHGYASSAGGEMRNQALVATVTNRGYAFVAPNGWPHEFDRNPLDWDVNDGFAWPRDDLPFLQDVLSDASERFGLDRDRVLAAGFSRGGSMIWDLACRAPETALAFAGISGGFWEPMFETCQAPVDLIHVHGFADRLVPIEGREVTFQRFDFVQGNIFKGLDVWRRINGCMSSADDNDTEGGAWRKVWTSCEAGSITLILWPGGHGYPPETPELLLDWFEARHPNSQ